MELIYMYIKEYRNKPVRPITTYDEEDYSGFSIENQGINFGDSFECVFELDKSKAYYTGDLIIKDKRKERKYPNFYAENISSVTAFVGENGSGKTTLLDLIGMVRADRFEKSEAHKKKEQTVIIPQKKNNKTFYAEYSLVYFLQDINDNECQFYIETYSGYNSPGEFWAQNLMDSYFINCLDSEQWNIPAIGIVTTYNKTNDTFINDKIIDAYRLYNRDKSELFNNYRMAYYSFNHSTRVGTTDFLSARSKNVEFMLKRKILRFDSNEPRDFIEVLDFLYSPSQSLIRKNVINSNQVVVIQDSYEEYLIYDDELFALLPQLGVLQELIDSVERKKSENSVKTIYFQELLKRYITTNLNSIIREWLGSNLEKLDELRSIDESASTSCKLDKKKLENMINGKVSSNSIYVYSDWNLRLMRSWLEDAINAFEWIQNDEVSVSTFFTKKHGGYLQGHKLLLFSRFIYSLKEYLQELQNDSYHEAFEEVLEKICDVAPECFTESSIVLDASNYKGENTQPIQVLLQKMQEWVSNVSNRPNDIQRMFSIEIPFGSDGELVLIDIMSKLTSYVNDNPKIKSYILILDEPDQRLHPEWSRNLFNMLVKALSSFKERGNQVEFQILLTTHSAFMLSDFRQEDVYLLKSDISYVQENQHKKFSIEKGSIKTFGSNIYDLFKGSFMLQETKGQFAIEKMEHDLEILVLDKNKIRGRYTGTEKEKLIQAFQKAEYVIQQIGEPILRKNFFNTLSERKLWLEELTGQNEVHIRTDKIQSVKFQFNELSEQEKKKFIAELIQENNR